MDESLVLEHVKQPKSAAICCVFFFRLFFILLHYVTATVESSDTLIYEGIRNLHNSDRVHFCYYYYKWKYGIRYGHLLPVNVLIGV